MPLLPDTCLLKVSHKSCWITFVNKIDAKTYHEEALLIYLLITRKPHLNSGLRFTHELHLVTTKSVLVAPFKAQHLFRPSQSSFLLFWCGFNKLYNSKTENCQSEKLSKSLSKAFYMNIPYEKILVHVYSQSSTSIANTLLPLYTTDVTYNISNSTPTSI